MSARWSESGWAESRPLRDCEWSESLLAGISILVLLVTAGALIAASLVSR